MRICVVCEGSTEVNFVNSCLAPHLLEHGICAYPTPLRAPSGNHRGGRVTVERLGRFISHELHAADRITTLVDYYGFSDAKARSCVQLEQDIAEEVVRRAPSADPRFVRPYIQMYEFEGLLFSDDCRRHRTGDHASAMPALFHVAQPTRVLAPGWLVRHDFNALHPLASAGMDQYQTCWFLSSISNPNGRTEGSRSRSLQR